MAVRLREADNIAAMAELQQHISELEIQVKSQAFGNCNVHFQSFYKYKTCNFIVSIT